MNEIRIRIETKYCRMSIHRQALKAIGNPPFLHLGYLPETMKLMMIGSWVDDRKGIRVWYDDPSIYIFSKSLLTGIRQVSHILMQEGSYLVEGKAVPSESILIFPLKEARLRLEDRAEHNTDQL